MRRKKDSNTIKKIKILPQDLEMGSVLFSKSVGLHPRFEHFTNEKLTSMPIIKIPEYIGVNGCYGYQPHYQYYIPKRLILEYGLDLCVSLGEYYKIDYDYIEKYNKIEDCKTIEDVKNVLKDIIK